MSLGVGIITSLVSTKSFIPEEHCLLSDSHQKTHGHTRYESTFSGIVIACDLPVTLQVAITAYLDNHKKSYHYRLCQIL